MKRIGIVAILVIGLVAAMAGCGTSTPAPSATEAPSATVAPATSAPATETSAEVSSATTSTEPVTGTATAVGSSALQPLAQEAADQFMALNSGASIQVQGGGSGTGLTQVAQGGCDIGNSDVFAEEKLDADQAKTLVDHQVCVVGFATVVNPKVTVTNLTDQQLIDIFTGKITNWKDVGGNDMKIVILNRPESSGTRATFKKYALNGADEATGIALTEESSGTIKQALNDTDGAISYLALSYVDDTVKALQYNGVDPTAENICNGTYPIWSYEHMYTKGEATGAAKAFIDFMMSDAFAPSISKLGYIPSSDMKVTR